MRDAATTRPRRRRWLRPRYRLRTLLAVFTLACVALGLVVSCAERQRPAVAAIREAGGHVRYDFEPSDASVPVELPGPDWQCGLLGVDYFADVTSAYAGPKGTDATIAHVRRLTKLHELSLGCSQVTDAGMIHLKGLTSLQWLWLHGTQVTDAGLSHLEALTSLGSSNLQGTQVTRAGCERLQRALPQCKIYHNSAPVVVYSSEQREQGR